MITMEQLLHVTPLVALDGIAAVEEKTDMLELANQLDSAMEYAARVRAYLISRASGGNHGEAVKHSNRLAKSVRSALGFSQPQHDISF